MTADSAASPFDPQQQNHPPSVDDKLVAALERLSGVLRHLLWDEATRSGLSPLQLQVLVFLRFHPAGRRTVSALAQEYQVSRATVSEAVKTLTHKQLVARHADPADRRSHALHLTAAGEQLADQTSHFAAPLRQPVAQLPAGQKPVLYVSLLMLLYQLQRAGSIPGPRMCFSCRYYGRQPGRHYCHLLGIELEGAHLRLDCPEHEAEPA